MMSDVASKTDAVKAMHAASEMIDALLGGTETMRAKGERYLPKFALEDIKAWKVRLQRSVLYPALKETVSQMVGRVFFRDMGSEEVAPFLVPYLSNIDLLNHRIDVLCAKWFEDALAHGVSYMLADYPQIEGLRTLADDKAQGARPYWVHIPLASVLGFKSGNVGGRQVLRQFRYMQSVVEDDGEFGEKTVDEIVVLDIGRCRRYRQADGKNEWLLYSDTPMTVRGVPLPEIPVVAFQTEAAGFFCGKPPLSELAYLNVKHWQSQSDQDNILNTARVPLLARSGADNPGEDFQVSGCVVDLPEKGQLFYVEHSGAAIEAGAASLDELKDQMQAAGAKLLIKTRIAMTDAQTREEAGKEKSRLRMFANNFEDAVGQVLDFMAMWLGERDGGRVEISGNIDDVAAGVDADTLLRLNAAGVISGETLFEGMKQREVISPLREWDDELKRLERASPGLDFHDNQPPQGSFLTPKS